MSRNTYLCNVNDEGNPSLVLTLIGGHNYGNKRSNQHQDWQKKILYQWHQSRR